jgi:eukaryotic-like serine/threonine-protein kinase
MRCNERRLERVLREADEDSSEFRETARHVESCPHCRQRLAELSAADALLTEACETLRAGGEPTIDRGFLSSSVVIAVERLLGDEDPVDCETVSLDFLAPASHPEMLGRIGRYEVERLIGAGGMGVVLKGFDTELHRVVAIKVLLPNLATSAAARRRFAREAQAAAAVVHEHVIPIYNVETDGDMPYLVMQFVPGHSLQTRVDEHGPLAIKEVLRLARQAAAGLAAAHAQGVVHRDVKPANILLEESVDRVLISDFGLARTVDDATLTRTGTLAGTPHYMSPEQASGQSVDRRSDLFSLGSVIYFMCTGRPPYRAESPMAVLNRICHEPHRPVDEVNPDVPIELAELVDRLLAKDPARRFANATEVEARCAALLAELQQGHRLRRRTWLRRLRQNGSLAKRVAIGAVAALVCMSIGAWATWIAVSQNLPRSSASISSQQVPAPEPSRPAPPRRATPPTEAPTAQIPGEPPDPFPQDLLETRQRLQAMDARDNVGESIPDDARTQWQGEVSNLRSKLSALESPSPARQPTNPPSETNSAPPQKDKGLKHD